MTLAFEVKAKRATEYILENYEYCKVTPLRKIDSWGNVEELEPINCYNVEDVEDLFNAHYDVMIHTPCGCNY